MELSIPIWRRAPRTSLFIILAVILLAAIYVVSPAQLPVVLYKVSLIALAGVLGYWLDRVLFPYARPDSYLTYDWRAGSDEPIGEADHLCVLTTCVRSAPLSCVEPSSSVR